VIAFLILLLPFVLAGIPYLRLEWRRHQSRQHRPMPQELWLQDRAELLYIEAVDQAGVSLLTLDPTTRQLLRWVDSWATWHQRLRVRVVTYTGRSAVLNSSEWDLMRT